MVNFARALVFVLLAPLALAQTTNRFPMSNGLVPPANPGANSDISGDGRFVVFTSAADGLVPGDTNGRYDVFVFDRLLDRLELVSAAFGGGNADDDSGSPAITPDGRFVAFSSEATNLLATPATMQSACYLRDRSSGALELVSVMTGGGLPPFQRTGSPHLSDDGRFVVFTSNGTFVPEDTNFNSDDVYLRDRVASTTTLMCPPPPLPLSNPGSGGSYISGDGRFILFSTSGKHFAFDTNNTGDIFLRDRVAGTLEIVSLTPSGVTGNLSSGGARCSRDGRFITFTSQATDLAPGGFAINPGLDAFLRDRLTQTTVCLSQAVPPATSTDGISLATAISADGRYVVFDSDASNLITGDTNGVRDVFRYDTQQHVMERMSVTSVHLQSNGASDSSCISADGSAVSFDSVATNLVVGDTNNAVDVFVREPANETGIPFCYGDGDANGGPPCPCDNAVVPGVRRGCVNSTGNGGSLRATGTATLSGDHVTLAAAALPASTFALFLQSPSYVGAGLGEAGYFDGVRCVGTNFVRLGTRQTVGGVAAFGAPSTPLSLLGGIGAPTTAFYQVVYRNNAGFCNFLANSTNAVAIVWKP